MKNSSPSVTTSTTDETIASFLEQVDRDKLPRHIAVIMDGNGRWAQARGLPRIEGHRQGANSVRAIIEAGVELGLEQLTLYCLSSENWKRPAAELSFLMYLLERYLVDERPEILRQDIQFSVIGRIEDLSDAVRREIDTTRDLSSGNGGMRLCLALNYGARGEIVDAVRHLAERVAAGELAPEEINEQLLSDSMYTAGMPDPDLVVRSSGEMRFSNFLLWQISYSELWVTDKFWPDFGKADFIQAIRDYAGRSRRFGGLKS